MLDIELEASKAKRYDLTSRIYLQEEVSDHCDKCCDSTILAEAREHMERSMTSTNRWKSEVARQRRLEDKVSSR